MGFKDLPGGQNSRKEKNSSSSEFSKELSPKVKDEKSSKSK